MWIVHLRSEKLRWILDQYFFVESNQNRKSCQLILARASWRKKRPILFNRKNFVRYFCKPPYAPNPILSTPNWPLLMGHIYLEATACRTSLQVCFSTNTNIILLLKRSSFLISLKKFFFWNPKVTFLSSSPFIFENEM